MVTYTCGLDTRAINRTEEVLNVRFKILGEALTNQVFDLEYRCFYSTISAGDEGKAARQVEFCK
jgi:hypothetical protein